MRFLKEFKKLLVGIEPKNQKRSQKAQDDELSALTMTQTFQNCQDVSVMTKKFSNKDKDITIQLVQSEGLIDTGKLNEYILPRIDDLFEQVNVTKQTVEYVLNNAPLPAMKSISKTNELIEHVFNGELIIYFIEFNKAYALDIAKHPQRTPEEPNTEISLKGPRDGFIEELSVNIGLVRKRLKTNSLKVEKYQFGKRSSTRVALLYIEDIINDDILKTIKERLEKIPDIDALYSIYHLQDLLSESQNSIVPLFNYTGRPDFVTNALLQGRFTIFVDGMPTAIIAPVSLPNLTKTSEDNEYVSIYVVFTRILRLIGIFIAAFLPGFWVAIVTYHQDQIPYVMLGTLAETRKGVPFPSPFEALVMLGMFELFREAGMRLPAPVGQTLTVVGGLIIGQAAIQAGITNPAMVVIIATSHVATFTIVDQSLVGSITVIRFIVLFLSAFLGLFGVLSITFLIFTYMSNVRSFTIPYLAPYTPFTWRDFLTSTLSRPWKDRKERAKILKTKDSTSQE